MIVQLFKIEHLAIISIVGACLMGNSEIARANIFEDTWGILTDPLKLNSSTENVLASIDRAAFHAERIGKQIDGSAKARLEQIDKTVSETRADLLKAIDDTGKVAIAVTDNAFSQLNLAQTKLFQGTQDLVKCTTVVTINQLKTELADSLNKLGKRKPRLEIFGWTILTAAIDPEDIKFPKQAFNEVLDLYQKKISEIGPNDDARKLTDYYGEIRRQAQLTLCHYEDDSTDFDQLYRAEIEFARRQKYWIGLVYAFGKY